MANMVYLDQIDHLIMAESWDRIEQFVDPNSKISDFYTFLEDIDFLATILQLGTHFL